MNGDGEPRLWLIAGPTGGGKSALALDLARETGAEIVNADSMQIYADLRVLTARPSAEDEARARHHLFAVADTADAWSVGRWLRAATEVLREIAARGRPAIVVGGTGLYFRALTQGLADIPAVPVQVRRDVATLYDNLGETTFRETLAVVDPAAAARIAPGDRQRLTRALEVHGATGRSLSDWRSAASIPLAARGWRGVVLDPARDELYRRCDARLGVMLENGALDEVSALIARDLDPNLPVMKALGVAPFASYLRGEISRDDALARARQDTRRYVKRQTTWFRTQTPDWPRIGGPADFANALGYGST